jgi:hypothetical protein
MEEAEVMARTAVKLLEGSDAPQLRADSLCELASVLAIRGKSDDARSALQEAMLAYRTKGDLVSLRRATESLGRLS